MDANPISQPFFAGEFRHSIDEKNRITIPSRWRRGQTEEFIICLSRTISFFSLCRRRNLVE
jgi:DNA-binding transcriptional regulator/RsmH inhibitor MraZ